MYVMIFSIYMRINTCIHYTCRHIKTFLDHEIFHDLYFPIQIVWFLVMSIISAMFTTGLLSTSAIGWGFTSEYYSYIEVSTPYLSHSILIIGFMVPCGGHRYCFHVISQGIVIHVSFLRYVL